jgi:nucleotide-binding universal stress UspA family protein
MTTAPTPARVTRILAATDLSARSDRAVERAVLLAAEAGSTLTILHVVDADLPARMADRQADDARLLIEAHVASVAGGMAVACDSRVVFGKDHVDVLAVAEEVKAGLVVIGVHRSETRELFAGTTAERVLREGATPVLLVKTRPSGPYRRPLVAVDLSECSGVAVEFAARLLPGRELQLVHAFDTPYKAFLTGESNRREAARTHHEQMEEFVRRHCAHLQPRPAPIVRQGSVGQVIRDQVEHLRPDLLVVGTHGRGGLARAVLGSVAEDLLSRPPCDVLAVRP